MPVFILCRFACTDLLYILHLLKYLPGYPLHSEVRLVLDWFCYKIKYGHYKQNKICSVYTFKFASTAHVWIVLLKVPMPHFVLFFLTWINSWQSKFFFRLCLCSDFFGDIFYRIFPGFLTSWDTLLFAQSVDSPQFHVKVFDASSVKDFVSKVIEQNRTEQNSILLMTCTKYKDCNTQRNKHYIAALSNKLLMLYKRTLSTSVE